MCLFIKMSSSSSICIEVAHLLQSSLWEWREGGDDKGGKWLQLFFFGGGGLIADFPPPHPWYLYFLHEQPLYPRSTAKSKDSNILVSLLINSRFFSCIFDYNARSHRMHGGPLKTILKTNNIAPPSPTPQPCCRDCLWPCHASYPCSCLRVSLF